MTKKLGKRDSVRRSELGIIDIQPGEGAKLLCRLIGHSHFHVGVFPVNWEKFLGQFPPGAKPAVFSEIVTSQGARTGGTEEAAERTGTPIIATVMDRPENDRQGLIEEHVRRQLIGVVKIDKPEQVDFKRGLSDLGLDSLMMMELRTKLQSDFNIALPAAAMFEHPTIQELSSYIFIENFKSIDGDATGEGDPVETACNESNDSIDSLSEDEAEQALLDELRRSGY
jgi:acyl carrier protein